jgi:hypothetical protein
VMLVDAAHRVRMEYVFAYTLMAVGILGLLLGVVKYVYFSLPNDLIFSTLGRNLQQGINSWLRACPVCDVLWTITPTPTFMLQWHTFGNYVALLLLCLLLLGAVIRDSARHLSQRVRRTKERVEEAGWARALSSSWGATGL